MAVLVALQHGVSLAHEQGRLVRHLVLTDRDGTLDFASFYRSFSKRLVPRLRRAGYLAEYAVALEVQPTSGRLHGHMLVVEPHGTNGFIPKPWLDGTTSACGFGWSYITLVKDIPPVGASLLAYFVKGAGGDHTVPSKSVGVIGSYMSKSKEMERLAGLASTRLRPFRVSRDWPLSLSSASSQLREEMFGGATDPGPWTMVREERVQHWLEPLRAQQRTERARLVAWNREAQLRRDLLGAA